MEETVPLVLHIVEHAFWDTIRLVPFLFVTYLIMEFIEHKAGKKAEASIIRAGKVGPVIGALLGALPQCGFSAAASTFYAGRVITLGTLLAVFLSTSDEMIPMLIAVQAPIDFILMTLGLKVFIGFVVGLMIDFVTRRFVAHDESLQIHDLCAKERCHCSADSSILKSALKHTVQVTLFIFVITLVLGGIIEMVGEETLAHFMAASPILSVFAASIVGLIPNCAASVAITQLYLEGALSYGALIAGLLVSSGVGLLVLLRTNRPLRRNIEIITILLLVGIISGVIITAFGF